MNNIKYLNPQKPMTAAGVGCTRLELWLVDLPKPSDDTHVQYGVRPAIVISNDAANENSPAITVIPLTSNRKKGQLRRTFSFPTPDFLAAVLPFANRFTRSTRGVCSRSSARLQTRSRFVRSSMVWRYSWGS